MQAKLVLEDGKIFTGKSCGLPGTAFGEVMVNSFMSGYQETITDPAYAGALVSFTYPLVGGYGVHRSCLESNRSAAKGVIFKELCTAPGGSYVEKELEPFLVEQELIGICNVDTRALTLYLRDRGTMRGAITTEDSDLEDLVEKIQKTPVISEQDLVSEVTCNKPYILPGGQPVIAVVDLGVKHNILRNLTSRGCTVLVLPADSTSDEILDYSPQGVLFSSGPGDPEKMGNVVETITGLLGKIPLMGISLGHQLLGMALDCKISKLKFGHRGNYPVINTSTGEITITSQNHGFVLDKEGLSSEVKVTYENLNDKTVEGIEHKKYAAFSVQFNPEGAPGSRDLNGIFDRFIGISRNKRGGQSA